MLGASVEHSPKATGCTGPFGDAAVAGGQLRRKTTSRVSRLVRANVIVAPQQELVDLGAETASLSVVGRLCGLDEYGFQVV